MATNRRWPTPNVWLGVAGLPPAKLPHYDAWYLPRLAERTVFGTD